MVTDPRGKTGLTGQTCACGGKRGSTTVCQIQIGHNTVTWECNSWAIATPKKGKKKAAG